MDLHPDQNDRQGVAGTEAQDGAGEGEDGKTKGAREGDWKREVGGLEEVSRGLGSVLAVFGEVLGSGLALWHSQDLPL